jgi:hypothetical protein
MKNTQYGNGIVIHRFRLHCTFYPVPRFNFYRGYREARWLWWLWQW